MSAAFYNQTQFLRKLLFRFHLLSVKWVISFYAVSKKRTGEFSAYNEGLLRNGGALVDSLLSMVMCPMWSVRITTIHGLVTSTARQ